MTLTYIAVSPILVESSQTSTDTVRKVKDFKRRILGNGRPYFARRCLTDGGRKQFNTHWPMEILFNYLGQYQVRFEYIPKQARLRFCIAIGTCGRPSSAPGNYGR